MTNRIRIKHAALTGVAAIALSAGTAAYAQQTAAVEEIVVTGTLIRGIEPVGSNTVNVTREDIAASGAIDSNLILSTLVPQASWFMDLPEPGNGNVLGIPRVPINRPSLRNMGDPNAGSGSPTLVLLNGSRIVPAGIEQSTVDVGIIPTGIVERQEIILDGASAVYGTDAVGGAINYIPRTRFDTTDANVQYGFADDYWSLSANVTSGKKWDTGGLGLTYSFGKSSQLLERNRDYARSRDWFNGGRPTGTGACDGYGHVAIGSGATLRRFVATEGSTVMPERTDYCDPGYNSLTPPQVRHGGFVSFSQDVTDTIKLDVAALYSYRKTTLNQGPFTGTVTIRPTNPYYRSLPGVPAASQATQSVGFSYGSVLGYESASSYTYLEVGQVSPQFTIDLGQWQARVSTTYGRSKSATDVTTLDTIKQTAAASGTTLTTAINPYDINLTQNKALIGDLLWHNTRDGIHDFYQVRAIGDGPLFDLPGGQLKAAFGAEWSKTSFKRNLTDATTHLKGGYQGASISNKAVFGELNIPVVGPSNAMPLIEALTLSVSARYDSYTDFGNTFNPKFAVTWEPVSWLTFKGNWGKSFRAPNAVDKLGSAANNLICSGSNVAGCGNFNVQAPPNFTLPTGVQNVVLSIQGTADGLVPEKSKNWSIGFDVRPIERMTLSLSYFDIDFTDAIGFVTSGDNTNIFLYAPQLWTLTPTLAQLNQFATLAPNGPTVVQLVRDSGYNVVYSIDSRVRNLSARKVGGLDLSARYSYPMSWGTIDATFNGSWRLKEKTQFSPLGPLTDTLRQGQSLFRATMGLGATIGDFRAQATLQHRAGYNVDPSTNRVPDQTGIDQFDILNMSFRYNVNGNSALTQDLTLSLNVQNVLDTAPPQNRTNNGGTTNGSTLGRLIQFGVAKKF